MIVNERYDESKLKEGYAPFCKHLFIANDFTDAVVNVLPITAENEACLRTKYEARNENEVRRIVLSCRCVATASSKTCLTNLY
jgi:hypothetical protein